MPEFLKSTFAADLNLNWTHILFIQVVALLMGVAVALVYRFSRGANGSERQSLMATLVLLTLLISMISSIIGDNVARAFSLVGALSIVRFRTVVEDTRDTAFVILAVGVGMALGSGHFVVPLILIPMAGVAACIFGPRMPRKEAPVLYEATVRLGLGVDDAFVRSTLADVSTELKTTSASTFRQGTGIEMTYDFRLRPGVGLQELHNRVKGLDGVVGVDLKQA